MKLSAIKLNPKNMIPAPNYSGYYCTSDGRVYSDKKGSLREVKGSVDKNGYLKLIISIAPCKYKYFRKHRFIIMAFKGESPLKINHKDGDKTNNAISNLEYVTNQENQCHRRLSEGKIVGVCWGKKERKWRAYIQVNKQWMHLGFYETKEEAKNAYVNKHKELNIKNKYAITI